MALLTLIAIVARNSWAFTERVYEHGDAALNSILVQNSHHELLLTGPVSRVGFPHPGPAFTYVLVGGQALFHDWLPVSASAYGGQFLGTAVLQAVLLGLVVRTIYRLTWSLPATAVSAGLVFWFAASHRMIGETWLPYLYMAAFALLVVTAIALCDGRTRELPTFVFAAGLLVHGHVAFLLFVGLTGLLTVLGWLLAHRQDRAADLRAHRRQLWWALAIALVFLAPMAAEVTWHYPGPWPDYLSYHGAGAGHDDGDSLAFFGHFWSDSYSASVLILACAGALTGMLLERDAARLRLLLRGYLVLALESALFLYYVMKGIDALEPINFYTGWFYETVPMFLLVLPAVHLILLARQAWPGNRLAGRVAALGLVALVAAGLLSPSLTEADPSNPAAGKLLAALAADPHRAGRPIVLRFQHDEWSFMAAVLVEGRRTGLPMCVTDPYWTGLFTPAAMCPDPAGHWAVASVSTASYHGGKRVIWSDRDHVVFEGTVPNLPPAKQ